MIRGLFNFRGRVTMLCGISAVQLARLQGGEPIFVDGTAHGMGAPLDVLIACDGVPAWAAQLVAEAKRSLVGIALGPEDVETLTAGRLLYFARPEMAMATVLVYGETDADVVRAAEDKLGIAFPVTAEHVAANPPKHRDDALVIDLRKPQGNA